MVSGIENSVTALLGLALDGTVMRHQAIANNIANASTPGYRPVDVSFDEQLKAARDAMLSQKGGIAAAVSNFQPTVLYTDAGLSGDSSVSLDMEVAKLSENTLHQQVLLKALNNHFSILDAAIKEGKQ